MEGKVTMMEKRGGLAGSIAISGGKDERSYTGLDESMVLIESETAAV